MCGRTENISKAKRGFRRCNTVFGNGKRERPFQITQSRGDHRSPAELLPTRRRAYSSLPSSESMSVMYGSRTFVSLQTVSALRAEFLFLSFSKEKETKKKGNLRACALKNPPDCTELLRSIKNEMFVFAAITGRASRDEIVRSGKRLSGKFRCTKSRGDHRSPAELLPMRRRAYPSLPSSESMSVMYGSRTFVSLQTVSALRAEFLFLSFSKEKETKKKGNLRACALKNPPDCTELLRSIKNEMFVFAAITGRASRDEIVRSGKRLSEKFRCTKSRGDQWSPAEFAPI